MKLKRVTWIRLILLAFFVFFISFEAYMHQVKGGGPEGSPSIHALCPYGGLESLYTIFTDGSLIDKVYSGTVVLFFLTVVLALLFRRSFCGWICPLGGIQEFLGRLGRKVLGRSLVMPRKLDHGLRVLKYPVLVFTAYLSWKTASMWVSPYDPWAAYGHLGEGLAGVWEEFTIGFIILVITFAGSFLYDRFFCKYLCPMGAFLGLISKISPTRIVRDKDLCIDCNLCTKVCSMNIPVARVENVTSPECINCQECTAICPKEGALTNRVSFLKKISIKPAVLGFLVLLVYFGGIGIAKISGQYSLLPDRGFRDSYQEGAEGLKGYMTLNDISIVLNMPLDEVYARMGIPASVPADVPAKELSQLIPGFSFHDAREALDQ